MKVQVETQATPEMLDEGLCNGTVIISDGAQNGEVLFTIKSDHEKVIIMVGRCDSKRFPVGVFKIYDWTEHMPHYEEESFIIVAMRFHGWLRQEY